jgi:peptidoglycan/LPS O-acetylase OafA/YrhL
MPPCGQPFDGIDGHRSRRPACSAWAGRPDGGYQTIFGVCCRVRALPRQLFPSLRLAPPGQLWVLNVSGARAVVFFYIVSGSLISYVLEHKYTPFKSGTLAFYRSRTLRIYPLWWPVLVCTGMAFPPAWLSQHHAIAILLAAVLFGVDWVVFWRYPHPASDTFPSLVEIGWTLGAEITFYAMAPWVLRSIRLTLIVFALAMVSLVPYGANYVLWTYFFFPSTLMFFLMGHLAQRFVKFSTTVSVALVGAASVASCLEPPGVSVDGPWSLVSSLCFAAAFPGILAATNDSRLSNALGDLTYPLYLVHKMVIQILRSLDRSGIEASSDSWRGAGRLENVPETTRWSLRAASCILTLARTKYKALSWRGISSCSSLPRYKQESSSEM